MKRIPSLFILIVTTLTLHAVDIDRQALATDVFSGEQDQFHCQGIAYDEKEDCFYMSFTTSLVKTDRQGRLLGSVVGLTGHLGCMSLDSESRRLYASNEYKHDAIGKGIQSALGDQNSQETGFYIAIFDIDRITRPGMKAEEVMKTVYIAEAVKDYNAQVTNRGKTVEHRFGCSGIDGVAVAPANGKKGGKKFLYVAYGIYGDNDRTDNDYQVILCYDINTWNRHAQSLSPQNLHHSGPQKPHKKYFVYTGNTNWGIQNLNYDPHTGYLLAACYKGKKEEWGNFDLYAINLNNKARKEILHGVDTPQKALVLPLSDKGIQGPTKGEHGWRFPYGSTGLNSLGNGLFYISEEGKNKDTKRQYTHIHLYRWTGRPEQPFERL